MSIISIEGMSFYAFHGCFDEERTIGTFFEVDLNFEVDTSEAQVSDNIGDTVDYQKVYQIVKSQMNIPSHLLEHVADRIVNSLHLQFPTIKNVRVKVSKLNPPLGGKIDRVSVSLEKQF